MTLLTIREVNRLNAVYFDFDGTLADSMGCFDGICRRVFAARGAPLSEAILRTICTMNDAAAKAYLIAIGGVAPAVAAALLEDVDTAMREEYVRRVPLKAGAADLLHRLKAEGIRLGLLTANVRPVVLPLLCREKIDGLFDRICCGDDFPMNKADPVLYRRLADDAGLLPEAMTLVDDTAAVLKAARSAGWKTVGVQDDYTKDDTMVRQAAHHFIGSFAEWIAPPEGGQPKNAESGE